MGYDGVEHGGVGDGGVPEGRSLRERLAACLRLTPRRRQTMPREHSSSAAQLLLCREQRRAALCIRFVDSRRHAYRLFRDQPAVSAS